jgi:hypothetical protein
MFVKEIRCSVTKMCFYFKVVGDGLRLIMRMTCDLSVGHNYKCISAVYICGIMCRVFDVFFL